MLTSIKSGLALVASLACLAGVPAQDSAVLRLKLQKDTNTRFRTVTTTAMEMLGQQTVTTVSMDQSISFGAQREGWTTVLTKTDEVKMEGDAMVDFSQAVAAAKSMVVTMDVNDRGLASNFKFESKTDTDPMVTQILEGTTRTAQAVGFMGVVFPEQAVSPGSEWNAEIDAAKLFPQNEMITAAKGKLPVTFKLLGFETTGGKKSARISIQMSGTVSLTFGGPSGQFDATMKITSATTNWIELANGLLLKSEGISKATGDFVIGTMSQDISVKVSRIE